LRVWQKSEHMQAADSAQELGVYSWQPLVDLGERMTPQGGGPTLRTSTEPQSSLRKSQYQEVMTA
jgi:hypothetical protein